MQLSSNEILSKIPGSWSEVTLDMWINTLMKLKTYKPDIDDPLSDVYVSLQVISDITLLPMDIVQKFPMELIKKANKKLSFLGKDVDANFKPSRKWVTNIEEPTYDDFITYVNVSKQINENDYSNFPIIVKSILKEKLSDEEILKLPMDEVHHGFFLLRESLRRFLSSTSKDLHRQTLVMMVNEAMEGWEEMTYSQKFATLRKKYKGFTDGIFWPRKSATGQARPTTK
jgi:hypothetical protein